MDHGFAPHDDLPDLPQSGGEALTGIPLCYTLADTPEPGSETDRIMINHFLRTLAEIALSVASRSLRERQKGEV